MKNVRRIIWGIILVAAAVIIALNSFELIDFDIFFDGWWTLFIIVPCFVGLFDKGDKLGNLFGIALGVCLLLSAQEIIEFAIFWKLLIPILIAYAGLKLIFSSFTKRKTERILNKIKMEGRGLQRGVAVFCGSELDFSNAVFEGADLTACFGGIDCDLSKAIIDRNAVIKVCCVFGGIEIIVPDNVKVVTNTACVFGGIEVQKNNSSAEHTIYVEGFCAFGGVDVK